jgi:hypothetical protein
MTPTNHQNEYMYLTLFHSDIQNSHYMLWYYLNTGIFLTTNTIKSNVHGLLMTDATEH